MGISTEDVHIKHFAPTPRNVVSPEGTAEESARTLKMEGSTIWRGAMALQLKDVGDVFCAVSKLSVSSPRPAPVKHVLSLNYPSSSLLTGCPLFSFSRECFCSHYVFKTVCFFHKWCSP